MYEDLALINELYKAINRGLEQQSSIRGTCKALLMVHEDDAATELQELFEDLLNLMESSVDEIWIPDVTFAQVTNREEYIGDPNSYYLQLQKGQRYALLGNMIAIICFPVSYKMCANELK